MTCSKSSKRVSDDLLKIQQHDGVKKKAKEEERLNRSIDRVYRSGGIRSVREEREGAVSE